MKENTQDFFLNTIVEVLIHNLTYYLPKEMIPEIVLVDLKGKISPQFFNKLAILDVYQGIGEFEVMEFSEQLAKKRQRLEKTIFELLAKRKELEEDEFEYLLDKYFRQVEFYLAITNWLRLNTATYKRIHKQIDLSIKGHFEMQYRVYELHFTELINRFYKGKELNLKESFTLEEQMNCFQDLMMRLQLFEEELVIDRSTQKNQNELLEDISLNQKSEVITQTATTVNKQQNSTKKKKRPMVTEQEAYDFLLTSVFNVDPTIILK